MTAEKDLSSRIFFLETTPTFSLKLSTNCKIAHAHTSLTWKLKYWKIQFKLPGTNFQLTLSWLFFNEKYIYFNYLWILSRKWFCDNICDNIFRLKFKQASLQCVPFDFNDSMFNRDMIFFNVWMSSCVSLAYFPFISLINVFSTSERYASKSTKRATWEACHCWWLGISRTNCRRASLPGPGTETSWTSSESIGDAVTSSAVPDLTVAWCRCALYIIYQSAHRQSASHSY